MSDTIKLIIYAIAIFCFMIFFARMSCADWVVLYDDEVMQGMLCKAGSVAHVSGDGSSYGRVIKTDRQMKARQTLHKKKLKAIQAIKEKDEKVKKPIVIS